MRTTVKNALADVGCTVYWLAWTGQGNPPATYITFSTRESDAMYASDFATETKQTVYVEIWSNGEPAAVYSAVKAAMKSSGFALAEAIDLFDNPGYHISMTYNFVGL